jgi:transcriptional pleiotropic regulator of transition state genes
MKAKGIVRRLDDLGRIVLPIEMRRSFDLAEHDRVEICAQDDTIILRKYEPNCIFCGGARDLKEYRGKQICAKCAQSIGKL